MHKIRIKTVFALCVCIALSGCDQDPLRLSCRELPGHYCLELFEDHQNYCINDGKDIDRNGGGVLEGTVELIGWNDNYIVALRHATFRGDRDGWMVIDVKRRKIQGPFDRLSALRKDEIAAIPTMPPDAAWQKLGKIS